MFPYKHLSKQYLFKTWPCPSWDGLWAFVDFGLLGLGLWLGLYLLQRLTRKTLNVKANDLVLHYKKPPLVDSYQLTCVQNPISLNTPIYILSAFLSLLFLYFLVSLFFFAFCFLLLWGFLYGSSFLPSSFHFGLLLLEVIIVSVMWILFISFTISLFHNIKMIIFLVFLIKVSFFSCFY